jgi:glycosyltransferase involved in cell wall biosynthesis
MSGLHVIVPADIDDPARPSGGNVYDRRICTGLVDLGWDVEEHPVRGSWPCPGPEAVAELTATVAAVPDDALLLVDGLIASVSADVLVAAARRSRLVVLVHMPLAVAGEDAVLAASRAVITTSAWTRMQLLGTHPLDATAVHVVEPGADRANAAGGTPGGENLLCVAPVSRHKGQDVLLSALADLQDLTWHCRLIGSVEREPAFVEGLRQQVNRDGLADRVELSGVRTGHALARAYATSDLLVHPSRGETYGMVVSEALAHALPVVATDVGGVAEALGDTTAGRPGLLVNPDEPRALSTALRTWLSDDATRSRLRCAAAHRRETLTSWRSTAIRMAHVLAAVAT